MRLRSSEDESALGRVRGGFKVCLKAGWVRGYGAVSPVRRLPAGTIRRSDRFETNPQVIHSNQQPRPFHSC